MWDHGAHHGGADVDEHFRSFFAARTPGATGVFPDGISPVNVLRVFVTNLTNVRHEPLPYRAVVSDWHLPLNTADR